jgi:hypothetical protein
MKRLLVIGIMAASVSLVACEDGGESCESICLAAQDGNCTWIDDCYEFCDVTWSLAAKADCRPEYDAYHSCAESTQTCSIDSVCGNQEGDMLDCAIPYCSTNPNDTDCVTALNW